ncbi:AraC family transcriptional regulator [Nocardia sp. BMG51109]|uniref:AraC family transcriptional regulator n=1 Tax=Nocardia sp. BMG51109 TaxID=1056816 RepID=UPI001E4335CF|nr:AraC family transcriptional regulator [Nocardia sp. BMG51109]
MFRRHALRILGDPEEFDARHRRIRWGSLSVHELSFASPVEIRAEEDTAADFYTVAIPLSGTAHLHLGTSGRPRVTMRCGHSGAVIGPFTAVRTWWSAQCVMLLTRIDAAALTAHLETLLQERIPPRAPAFSPELDIRGCGGLWHRLLRAYLDMADMPGTPVCRPPLARVVEQSLLTTLLVTARHDYRDRLVGGRSSPVPPELSRIVEHIHRNPTAPKSVADLAAVGGMSVRSLQEIFSRYLDTTPTAYLRRVRLWRARADLLASPAQRGAVAIAAARWGFSNLGRFAQAYRDEFGVSPSNSIHVP